MFWFVLVKKGILEKKKKGRFPKLDLDRSRLFCYFKVPFHHVKLYEWRNDTIDLYSPYAGLNVDMVLLVLVGCPQCNVVQMLAHHSSPYSSMRKRKRPLKTTLCLSSMILFTFFFLLAILEIYSIHLLAIIAIYLTYKQPSHRPRPSPRPK